MNFIIDNRTPSASGSAPPDRDVPGAAGHDLHVIVVAVLQNLRDMLDRFPQHDDQRQLPVRGQGVGLVGAHFAFLVDHTFSGHDRL